MAKEETIGFVGLSLDDIASLDGPACHICGAIMVPCQELIAGELKGNFFVCLSCGTETRPS